MTATVHKIDDVTDKVAEDVMAHSEAVRVMDAFDREVLRKCLDETIAQSRCDKDRADADIKATDERMKELSRAYFAEKALNAEAVEKWRKAHVSELRAEERLATLLKTDAREARQ